MDDIMAGTPTLLLKGRTALITGAAGGIGCATARVFAREGARLVLSDVNNAAGQSLCDRIRAAGAEATFIAADVASESDCDAMVAHAMATFGRLDIAFNNAGYIGVASPLHSYPKPEFRKIFDTNIEGLWNCVRSELPVMLAQGGGVVINTSSAAGMIALPHMAPYVMAKHAIVGLTKAAAVDYAKENIRFNAVLPGTIDTAMARGFANNDEVVLDSVRQMIPVGRLGGAAEIAEMVAFLASDRSSYATGSAFLVDGGWTAV